MSMVIKNTESGDWYLVPYLKADTFVDDEYEDKVDYLVISIGSPSCVRILDYELD